MFTHKKKFTGLHNWWVQRVAPSMAGVQTISVGTWSCSVSCHWFASCWRHALASSVQVVARWSRAARPPSFKSRQEDFSFPIAYNWVPQVKPGSQAFVRARNGINPRVTKRESVWGWFPRRTVVVMVTREGWIRLPDVGLALLGDIADPKISLTSRRVLP